MKIRLKHPEHINISIDTDELDEENSDEDEEQDGKSIEDEGKIAGGSVVSKGSGTDTDRRPYFDDLSNHLKIGIIGPTNVGKSSLFNILTKSNTTVHSACTVCGSKLKGRRTT